MSRLVVDRCDIEIEEQRLRQILDNVYRIHCFDSTVPPEVFVEIAMGSIKMSAGLRVSYKTAEDEPKLPQMGPYR